MWETQTCPPPGPQFHLLHGSIYPLKIVGSQAQLTIFSGDKMTRYIGQEFNFRARRNKRALATENLGFGSPSLQLLLMVLSGCSSLLSHPSPTLASHSPASTPAPTSVLALKPPSCSCWRSPLACPLRGLKRNVSRTNSLSLPVSDFSPRLCPPS